MDHTPREKLLSELIEGDRGDEKAKIILAPAARVT